MKILTSLLAGGWAALDAGIATAQQPGGADPGFGYMPRWGGGWHPGWMFGPVLWILVLVALFVLIARAGRSVGYQYRRSNALDILAERFVRGEIDKAEFEEKRKPESR